MIDFGVVYWENGQASYRECADEAQARETFANAPRSGDCAELWIGGAVVEREFEPDES